MLGLRRRRDARLALIWDEAVERGGQRGPHQVGRWRTCECLGKVVKHRQRARRGTKVLVRWEADGVTTPAWFWYGRPPVGAYVLATGQYADGTQEDESVFYVEQGAFRIVPARVVKAATRHRRRVERSARRAAANRLKTT